MTGRSRLSGVRGFRPAGRRNSASRVVLGRAAEWTILDSNQ